MLNRILFAVLLCIFVGAANAAEITRNPQESDSQFVSRYAPNDASAALHVASAKVWGFEEPVIVAFYEYPVTYADKNKNYSDNPNAKEVLGVLFVPVNSQEYRKFEIDVYRPKVPSYSAVAVNAEIRTVFFANTDKVSDKKLFVIVSWKNELYSTYIYEKPQLNSEKSRLVYIEKLSRELSGSGINHTQYTDIPAKYKTASDVRADLELRMLMNLKEDCTYSITRQPNKDRSLLILLVSECPDRKERNIQVLYQASQSAKNQGILQLKQEISESPNGRAGFIDLEKDGMYELEVTNTCGAGPNCDRDIYKLASDRKSMFHYFNEGYENLFIKDGFLVTAAKASCCSWELRYYPTKAKHYPITDMMYMVTLYLETDEEKEKCVYKGRVNGKWKVLKHPPKVIQICEP